MDLPEELRTPDFKLLDANDNIPSNIDPSTISYLSEFLWPPPTFFASNRCTTARWQDNGVAHSFHSRTIVDAGSIGDQGWTTVETVLIRLNTSFTPSGRFPVYSNESLPDADGVETRIGYDAAVCVEKYEPWIIEAYNTSIGSPTALRIVERGDGSTSLLPSGNIRGPPIANTRYLNTTGKNPAFFVAHDSSINQMVKDNGRDSFYVPSPTVGLVVPSHITFFLTLACFTGRFFHWRHWTRGIHRTIPRPVRRDPRPSRRGQRSTVPCGVRARRRTVVSRSSARICHLQAVAIDRSPDARIDTGNRRGTVRANATAEYSTKRIWGI